VRRLELTSSEGPALRVLSGRVEKDFLCEGGTWVKWACVRGCYARDLMPGVTTRNGVLSVLDALIWDSKLCSTMFSY
jgi:hypothetical protein